MEFFDLVNISERYLELVSPTTPTKIVTLGQYLRLREGSRVIDFACGYAEALVLWAERFGIVGVGVEVREHACQRARAKISERGLSNRIEIVCAKAAEYRLEEQAFDAATCIGASFVWGGCRPTIHALGRAIRPGGRVGIGEPYWKSDRVPPSYAAQGTSTHSESKLLQIARREGFDIECVVRASQDDWDRYESGNWHGLIRWLEGHPEHPDRSAVIEHLHQMQDEYLAYGRAYLGWAMYVLAPQSNP
jgi:SAM-dependent methyltransferase